MLDAKNYREFANWHITELTRQRFLPQEWPQDVRDLLFNFTGQDMLIISQLRSNISMAQLGQASFRVKLQHNTEWQDARQTAAKLVANAGLQLSDFADWNGFDLAVDFYRLRNAGQLALHDISPSRLSQYRLLTGLLRAEQRSETEQSTTVNAVFAQRFGAIFDLLVQFTQGLPDEHFLLDMRSGTIRDLE